MVQEEPTSARQKATEGIAAVVAAVLLTRYPTLDSDQPIGLPFIDESPVLSALSLMVAATALIGAVMYLLGVGSNRLVQAGAQRFREKALGSDEGLEEMAATGSATGQGDEREDI